MHRTFTLRLLPTKEQEQKFLQHIGASRFIYNELLSEQVRLYTETGCILGLYDLGKFIVRLKKQSGYEWLQQVSHHTLLKSAANLTQAYRAFLKKSAGFPKYKSRKHSILSFYSRPERCYIKGDCLHLDKIGLVPFKTSKEIPVESTTKFYNVTVQKTPKKWIVRIAYSCESQVANTIPNIMGLDVGVAKLATISDNNGEKSYISVTKTLRYKKAKYRLAHITSVLHRKTTKAGYSKSALRYLVMLQKAYAAQYNRRINSIDHIISDIIQRQPTLICIETLCIDEMQTDITTRKLVFDASMGTFLRRLQAKCEGRSIKVLKVPKNYPSTRLCSNCGNKHAKLKLDEREYRCPVCNFVCDRDINAARNLRAYALNRKGV